MQTKVCLKSYEEGESSMEKAMPNEQKRQDVRLDDGESKREQIGN